MNSKVYKSCAVPLCLNTSINSPNKLFVYVPHDETTRYKWLKLARRDPKAIKLNTCIYFCEDHFDLPNSMDNFMKYHVMGTVSQVRMKPGCIPTKFQCQPDRVKLTSDITDCTCTYVINKQRQTLIEEAAKDVEENSTTITPLELEDASYGSPAYEETNSESTMARNYTKSEKETTEYVITNERSLLKLNHRRKYFKVVGQKNNRKINLQTTLARKMGATVEQIDTESVSIIKQSGNVQSEELNDYYTETIMDQYVTEVEIMDEQNDTYTETTMEQNVIEVEITNEQNDSHTETTMEQNDTYTEPTMEQNVTEVQMIDEQNDTYTEITMEQNFTATEITDEQNDTYTETTMEQNFTATEITDEQNDTYTEPTMEQNVTEVEITDEQNDTYTETTMEQNFTATEITDEQNVTYTEPTMEQNVTAVEITDEQNVTYPEPTMEQNVTGVQMTDEQNDTYTEPSMEQNVTAAEIADEQNDTHTETTIEQNDTYTEPTMEQNVTEVQMIDEQNDTYTEITMEQYFTAVEITDEQNATHTEPTMEQNVTEVQITDEQNITYAEPTVEKNVTEVQMADEQNDTYMEPTMEQNVTEVQITNEQNITYAEPTMEKNVTEVQMTDEQNDTYTEPTVEHNVTEVHITDEQNDTHTETTMEQNDTYTEPTMEQNVTEVEMTDEQNVTYTEPTMEQNVTEVHITDEQNDTYTEITMEQYFTAVEITDEQNATHTEPTMEQNVTEVHITDEQNVTHTEPTMEQNVTEVHITDEQNVTHTEPTMEQNVTYTEPTMEQNFTAVEITDKQNVTYMEPTMEQNVTEVHITDEQNVTYMEPTMEQNVTEVHITDEQNVTYTETTMEQNVTKAQITDEQNGTEESTSTQIDTIEIKLESAVELYDENIEYMEIEHDTYMETTVEQNGTKESATDQFDTIEIKSETTEEQNDTYTEIAVERNATYTEIAVEQNATYTEIAVEQNATYTETAVERNATYTEIAVEQNATYTETAVERNNTYTEIAVERNTKSMSVRNQINTYLDHTYSGLNSQMKKKTNRKIENKIQLSNNVEEDSAIVKEEIEEENEDYGNNSIKPPKRVRFVEDTLKTKNSQPRITPNKLNEMVSIEEDIKLEFDDPYTKDNFSNHHLFENLAKGYSSEETLSANESEISEGMSYKNREVSSFDKARYLEDFVPIKLEEPPFLKVIKLENQSVYDTLNDGSFVYKGSMYEGSSLDKAVRKSPKKNGARKQLRGRARETKKVHKPLEDQFIPTSIKRRQKLDALCTEEYLPPSKRRHVSQKKRITQPKIPRSVQNLKQPRVNKRQRYTKIKRFPTAIKRLQAEATPIAEQHSTDFPANVHSRIFNYGSDEDPAEDELSAQPFVPRTMRTYLQTEDGPNEPESSYGANPEYHFDWKPQDKSVSHDRRYPCFMKQGPAVSVSDPYSAFVAIWDQDFMKKIALETNRYAKTITDKSSWVHEWKDTNTDEIYCFFAIILAQGLALKSRLEDYWGTDPDIFITPGFCIEMSYKRYCQLNRCLHFTDNIKMKHPFSSWQARLFKIQPVIDHLNQKFSTLYDLGRDIVLDESLNQWTGGFDIDQFMRKGNKIGIETREICDAATGYLWRFEVDIVNDKIPTTPLSKISAKVLKMLRDLQCSARTVWMSGNYNSPILARRLKNMTLDCAGLLNLTRPNIPNDLSSLKNTRLTAGEMYGCTSGDVDLFVFQDTYTSCIPMISTYHRATATIHNGARKPTVLHDYNTCVGKLDKRDLTLAMYPIERTQTRVWYKKFFRRLLNISVMNAHVLYSGCNGVPPETHSEFRVNVIRSILSAHRCFRFHKKYAQWNRRWSDEQD